MSPELLLLIKKFNHINDLDIIKTNIFSLGIILLQLTLLLSE